MIRKYTLKIGNPNSHLVHGAQVISSRLFKNVSRLDLPFLFSVSITTLVSN